jgi:hypothetical protein
LNEFVILCRALPDCGPSHKRFPLFVNLVPFDTAKVGRKIVHANNFGLYLPKSPVLLTYITVFDLYQTLPCCGRLPPCSARTSLMPYI